MTKRGLRQEGVAWAGWRRPPQGSGAGGPREGEPREEGPQEPVRREGPDGEDSEVPREGKARARAASEHPQAVDAHGQRRGTEEVVERHRRQPAEGDDAERAWQIRGAGSECPDARVS